MFISLLAVVCFLQGALMLSDKELIPFEPIQYVKSLTSPRNESSIWSILDEISPEYAGEMSVLIQNKLDDLLQGRDFSVVLAKGERIFSKKLSLNKDMKDFTDFPYMNLLSFVSLSMTILLENFQSKLITEPIGGILKGKDKENLIFKEHKTMSLLDVLTTLPAIEGVSSVYSSNSLVEKMNANGEVAFSFINSILGTSAKEAWMDALMTFGIDDNIVNPGLLKLSLFNIQQYAIAVIHDFCSMNSVPEIDMIDVRNKSYMFGWWVNCPLADNDCIFPELPRDLIFSVSSSLRIYISPSLELNLIVSNTNSQLKTMNDIIIIDGAIWEQIVSVVSMNSEECVSKLEDEPVLTKDEAVESIYKANGDQPLINLIHRIWPILVFLFWVISSHVWVYLVFHGCWFISRLVLRRTHIPRPKSSTM